MADDGYFDNTTVQSLDDGDIILIGEEHSGTGANRCKRMARHLIDEIDPQTLCVEYPPRNNPYHGIGAMGYFSDYAQEHSLPLIHIDKEKDDRREVVDSYGKFCTDANKFTYPIEEDGDLDSRAITDARKRIYDEYGREAYEAMYIDREIYMAGILREIKRRYRLPIMVGMGTFHIFAVRDMYNSMENKVAFGASRVFDFGHDRRQQPVVHA